jgi:hypothetical protein
MVGALALAALPATAQETTGSLKGMVADDVGTPIAGSIIEAVGPLGTLSTTSDAEGNYRFPRLPAGNYTVTARFTGFIDAATDVNVSLGDAKSINFSMQKTFSEEITVYSDTVSIDFTDSATTTSIREWEIDYLPRGRDFTDVVMFASGATYDNQGGGIMIDGASGLENRYIIDGIDTTDPEDGSSAVPMRAEMMEEVQVKSAGYAAEFGGAMGGVINAVTKSGSNQWHGSVFTDYENMDWNGSARPEIEYSLTDDSAGLVTYRKDDETRWDPGFSLGGPILRDKWWFFAAYQPGIRTRERTVEWVNGDPTDTYKSDFQVDYATLNTTVNISSSLLMKIGASVSPYTTEGLLPNRDGRSGLSDQDNYAPLGQEGERETYSGTLDWIASDNFIVSARGGLYHSNVEDTGIPIFDLIHNYSTGSTGGFLDRHPEIPPAFQEDAGWISDNLRTGVDIKNIYERTAAGIDGTLFFRGAGDHSLKGGYQYEEIYNDVQSGYNADRILYYWDRSYTTTGSESVTGDYGYFRLLNISALGDVKTVNQAIFLQDTWTISSNLTLNIGFRSENEEVPNYGATGPDPAIAFGWGDKVAPRIGFAWDVTGDTKWKIYGSGGVYYDVTKYEMPRGSFGGAKWVDYFYTFDTANPALNTADGCRTGSNTIFERPVCGAGTYIEAVDRRFNSVDPLFQELIGVPGVDPDLKPMENFEYQLGVDHQLTPTIQIGARAVHKEIKRAIEDVGFLFPGIGEVYVIANPGEGVTAGPDVNGLSFPKPKREYNALELTFDKRFTDNWSLRAYYTLSRLEGNYSGLANSAEQNNFGNPLNPTGTSARLSPNVSRLYDSVFSGYDSRGNLVDGPLATDRRHQIGAQFLYSWPFGLNLGVNQYIGSGTPISTVATTPIHAFFNPYGFGDLGRTPWLTQTDLSVNYTFTFGRGLAFTVGVSVLNLFDEDTATRVWSTRTVQDIDVPPEDFQTGFDFEAAVASLGPEAVDTAFGIYDTYQLPRVLRLNLKFEF